VSIDFGAESTGSFALEVYADFPLLGTVSRNGAVSAAATTSMTGFLNFRNSTFEAMLSGSTIWKDANILAFALADMW